MTVGGQRVLVTGASGLIGSALLRRLARVPDLIPVAAIHHRLLPESAMIPSVSVGSVGASTDWREALRGVATVVHLAARVHVMRERHPNPLEEFRRVNRHGSAALARACVKNGVRRLIFVSSVKANGDSSLPGRPLRPLDELRPSDHYGISKAEAEADLQEISITSGLELLIVRPTVVIGRGAVGNIRALVRAVNLGIPLPFGSVENRRSVVSLDNLTGLLERCVTLSSAVRGTHFAADAEACSTADLVGMVARALRRRDPTVSCPAWAVSGALRLFGGSDLRRRLLGSLEVSIDSSREALGWVPEITTEEGILRAVG